MHVISAFVLAFACDFDNLAVAIAYGTKKIKIGIFSNLIIATVTGVGTLISLMVGESINDYLPLDVANFIGSGVIAIMGIWIVWDTLEKKKNKAKKKKMLTQKREFALVGTEQTLSHPPSFHDTYNDLSYESFLNRPEKADKDKSGYIDAKEALALAFGLAINNLGSGIGGGISGLNIAITTVLSFTFSLGAIAWGYVLGKRFTTKLSAHLTGIISGILILGLGIYEYFIP